MLHETFNLEGSPTILHRNNRRAARGRADSGNPFGMACRRPSKGALFGLQNPLGASMLLLLLKAQKPKRRISTSAPL